MKGNENIREELKKRAPTLAKWKERGLPHPESPPGYFQSLPDDVIRRAKAEEGLFPVESKSSPSRGQITGGFWKWLAIRPLSLVMGGVAVLLIGIWGFWSIYSYDGGNATLAEGLDELEQSAINDYIANNISEFDMSLLLEAGLVSQNTMDEMLMDQLSDDELDEYLDEIIEGLDLEDLQDIL